MTRFPPSAGRQHLRHDRQGHGSGNFSGYKFVNRQYRTCTSQYGSVSVGFLNEGPRTPVVLDSKFVIW